MNRVELKNWSKEKITGKLLEIWKGILLATLAMLVLGFGSGVVQLIFGEKSTITSIVSILVEIISIPLSIGLTAFIMKFVRKDELDKNLIFDYYSDLYL